jgi:hypothetical protein
MSKSLFLIAGALLLTGCVGPRAQCRVSVANASQEKVTSVEVKDTAGSTYLFTDVVPGSMAAYVAATNSIERSVVLKIRHEDGSVSETTVDLGRSVPQAFPGRLVFQVEEGRKVRAFVLPDQEGAGRGELPWAVPPSWQGVTSIPGFSGGE